MNLFYSACRPLVAGVSLCVVIAAVGCTKDQLNGSSVKKERVPLAPISAFSPGIGAPGAGSMDTRGTGTIATGQGDDPINDPDSGAVPVSGAGSVPGARKGGRL